MFKKDEVETIIKDSLLELDGTISDKEDQYGLTETYFVKVNRDDHSKDLVVDFTTLCGKTEIHDKYKIKVERI